MSTILESIIEKQTNRISIVYLKGQIDQSNIEQMKNAIENVLKDNDTNSIILNLKNLFYINSMVIGWLTGLSSTLEDGGKIMVFSEPNQSIFDIIDLVGLPEIISTFQSNEDAIEYCKEKQK